jgi:hypothetical protein
MPDFKKRLVVVDQEQPSVLAPKPTAEQRNQETEKLLTDLQKKVQTGTASKEEIGLYNQNAEMAKNFIKEVDNIRANADNYTSKIAKLFTDDFSRLGDYENKTFSKISQQSMTPMGVTPAGYGYSEQQQAEAVRLQKYNQSKLKFQQEANKKLSKVQDYINTGNATALRDVANYLTGPLQKSLSGVDAQGKIEDDFYNKEIFDRTGRKTANYLLNLARAIDVSNMISNPNDNRVPEVKNAINQNNRIVDALNNPGYLKSIGRQLLSQEVGSKLYGQYQLDIHKKESASAPDNLIDFEATRVAADAIKNLATLDYRKKLAEYTRLKQFAEKTGNKVDVQKAEAVLKQSEDILKNTESFDMDKFLKTNYRQTYLEKKEEEADAVLRRQGLGPMASGIPVDPVKLYYATKAGLKSIANNFIDLAAGIADIGESDYFKAKNLYEANQLKYDKTGYTIGVDELGRPVESSQFRWKGADGKTHYNGYAIIESGLPVAEQMLETIALAEVGGMAFSGLRGVVAGAGRSLIGAERMALFAEKALATPGVGQLTKAISNPEVYNRMLTFGSVYATTYPRIYAEEYNNFKNPEDATKVAKMRAVVESLTESIIPNTPDLFKKGAVGLFDLGKKQYARDLSAGIDGVVLGLFPGASNKFIRNLGESATLKRAIGIGKDVFQEGVIEEEASLIGNYFVDKYAKSKNKDYVEQNELTFKNIVNTAVESAAAMLLTAPFMGGGTKRNDNQSIIAARWNIANNPELYKSVTASQLQAGEITQEQAAQKIAKIDQYSRALETLPIKNLSSIRDMKTLLENKDMQYQFFSNYLEKEALLDYVPTDEELPEYTKQLEKLDAELFKTQQLADKYDALSLEDKKKIIYDNFKSKLNDLTQSDDVSPAAIAASVNQAAADYKKNKNRLFSTELQGHINDLDAAMEGVKDKFKSFITNNNEGLTSEQRDYKTRLLAINRNFFEAEEVDKMLDVLTKAEVSAYAPLFEIQDENDFIEALARNYVTAKTNERPLTADGKLLYNLIQDQYVNDGLFERFVSKLPEDEALTKKEELKNRFWSRVVELKQKQEPGQVFPEVATTPVTESEKFDAAAAETDSKYKNLIANYRVATERDLTEDQQVIREETVDALVAEESLEDLVKALANVQSIFIGDNLKKIAEEVQEGKTDKLVEFLEENGATKKQIEKLLNKLGKPAKETKAEVTPKTEAKETVKIEEVFAGKTKPQIEADLKAKKEEIEKKRQEELKPITEEIQKIQKELDELEKETKGSIQDSKDIIEVKQQIQNLRNSNGEIPANKMQEFNKLSKKLRFLQMSESDQINKAIDNFIEDNNLTEKQQRYIKALSSIRNSFKEVLEDFNNVFGTNYSSNEFMDIINKKSINIGETLSQTKEELNEKIDNESKKAAEKLGIKIGKEYSASELDFFVQEHGSLQTKFIWNLIKNVAQILGVKTRFSLEKNTTVPKGYSGHYSEGKIDNRASTLKTPDVAARIIVHELVHGVTNYIINAVKNNKSEVLSLLTQKQINAAKKLSNLLKQLQSDPNTKDFYGSKNEDEILAELTHDGFVDALKNKKLNFVERFLDYILDILGIETNAYNEALQILKDMLENPVDYISRGFVTPTSLYSKEESNKIKELKNRLNELEQRLGTINNQYNKRLAEVLQQETEQLGKMMFDFTPEEQRVFKEYGSKTIPVVETGKVSDIFQPVTEPVKETAADEANESQEKLNQEAKELQPIEDIRENYVYLGITDTSYDNKTRLTDENVALVFAVIDRIEESVNSKDIRSLGYNLLMHSAREVFNRAGLNIQPKPTLEEFTEQFRVNGILVLPKNQVEFLFKFPNAIDTIKLGIITNEKGEPLFFDKLGQKVTTGTPIITSIGQTFEKEEGKGGKTLDDQFRASIPEDGQIAPLSMFVNGRKIVNKPISVRETNNLILHATEKQAVPVGGKTFFLYKGVVYLKTDNPDFPYRSTYSRYNTKETAEEIVTLIEAYNDSKLNPETSTLPDYFKSMTPDELIEYIHNYAFIPKNSSKHDWGITPVTRVGETEARFLNIYKKTGATPEERKNSRKNPIPREEAVNLVAKTAGAVSKKYFDGDLEFRPFKIEGGKVKAEKAINFKAWFGDFRKSGARIDGVANRNLAFAKQDVKELAQPVKKEKVETAVPVESLLGEEAPVSDIEAKKADIERRRQESIKEYLANRKNANNKFSFDENTKDELNISNKSIDVVKYLQTLNSIDQLDYDTLKSFVGAIYRINNTYFTISLDKFGGIITDGAKSGKRILITSNNERASIFVSPNNKVTVAGNETENEADYFIKAQSPASIGEQKFGEQNNTTGKPLDDNILKINAKYDAELASLEAQPLIPVISEQGKLPNDIKEEFKGKFIYATPGAGKTTLAQGMQGVVDTDALMIDEMKRRHPEFFAESGESVQNFIYRYVSNFNEKADIDKVVLNQAKQLASQGYTVLTGTAAFIKDADIVITAPVTLERVAQRFKNAQAAETFANKEAEEIKQSGKTAQPITNFLEYYLTNKGFVDPIDPSDTPSPVPTRRGRRGSDDQYTLLRSKIYANQITEAQNKVAKRWLDTVGKKAFGENRFIIEQFLTNPEAWATWSEAGVRLFADANFAEGYHESWHEFTQMFFKPNQREALYKEATKIYGKLDNETLEERLAEDFRQFMLTGIMPESIQKYKQSRTLFQKLADFLKNFFTNKKTVDRYFENLSVGKVGKRVGKPEFKTLKSAKTLSLYDNNDNLVNLSFEESKRYLDMIDEVFVMLGNYNATKGKEEGQGLSYLNVMYSPENIKRMYDDIFDYFVSLEDQADKVKDLAAQNELAKIFGLGNKNIDRILDYHLLNSPLFTKEMVSEVEELEEEELSDTNILKDELGKKSQLELADALVVNIIRTIPMVDSKGFIITNPLTDAPVFGDFTENWNILKNTLSGSTSYPEMLTRIEKLSQEYPQFGYLLAQLPKKITLDSAQQLRNLFFNTMSQEKVEGVQGNFNAEGKYNVSNTGTLDTKRVRDLWSLKFNTEKEGKYKIPSSVTNNFVLDPRIFEVYPEEPKSPEDVLDFLNGIGFNYSQKAQQAFIKDFNQLRTRFHYVYDKLKDVVLNSGTEVSDPFLSIREGHVNQKTGTLIKGKSYDLDRLVELESKHNLSFANDMIQTADGSSQFITNPPTYQTKVVAALNDPKYKYFEDLFVDFPELDPGLNWGLVNSAYLDYLFDFSVDTLVDGKVKHKRRTKDGEPVSLEIVTLNGVTSEEDYGFNEKTINLEDPEKHLGDVRTLLSPYGRVEENNRIGDKSTTRGLVLSNENYFLYNKDSYFREGKFNPKPQIWNIIYKYLEAEARITDKNSVYDIFNKNKFFEGIPQLAYFSEILSPELRTQVYEFFQNNTIEDFEGSPLEGLVKSALITWINTSANESQDLLSKFDSYKIKGKKNDFQVTLDELKRYHTLSMIHRIEQYKLFNYHPYYYKNAKEVEKRIGAFNASGTFSVTDRENLEYTQASLTMQKAFNDFADKTGIETLPRKSGLEDVTYLVAEDERLDSQTARENKEDYGIHYNNYAETKKKVDVQDAASLFTLDFFRKFHATSKGLSSNMKKEMDRQASIWANLLEIKSNPSNTEARDNMNKLLNEGPYFIFSVEKLQYAGPGKTPAELVPLFHKYSNKILLPSEMVDNEELFNIAVKLHASNADYLVFNTGTKIAETVKPVKLFSNGKVDSSAQDTGVLSLAYLKEQQEIKHKDDQLIIFATQFRKLLFKDVTTPEEKNLLKVYKAYIKELTGYDVDNYLSKITDKKAAVEFLVKELDKKNVSAITKDLIRVKETNGELEYAVDSIIERTLAESAIASSIRKSIIRQKFNGTQFVQFPVSLVRPDRKLKFYRMKNGKIASAEAITSFSKKYHSLLDLPFDDKSTIGQFDKDGNIINRYEALKRLNQKLKDDAFREKYKDSLTLAGVRIPVQGYNSMEKMEIVEFLPEESGQMILVPDELVVKSGGDFDIDKLFMYEPILKNGLMLTEENSTDPEKQKRSIIQNKLLNVIKERLSQKEIFLDLIEPNNVKDLDEFAKKAPEYLSGDTNKIIKDASGRDMWTNLINPHYQLYVYQLAQAMGMVGVAAKANTFQAAAQDAKLEIVDESQIDLIYLDTNKNSEGHIQLWKIYDVDNNNKISQIISQIISGAVDIIKNDNILKNNINPNTVSVALYLNMMGVRYEDINALLRDELVYRLSKGESFQDILRNSFREQYDYYGTFNMNGGFSNYGTAKAILSEFNKEDLLTDKSPAGSLARLAQFVILQSQQNNYVTPLLLNSDFDTQSFQNFEAVLRKEKAIQKVYADKFFNTDGITGVIYNSIVSPFKIDSSFIKNFEDIFPISANKGLTNYIVDFYGELENPWIDYENFSRRFKNGLLTSILETNMSEFEEYAQYLKVDPTIKNLQDMASEIKKEAAENGAYIPLLDSINFSGDINSEYIAPGIFRNDNNLDVDIKKEQFKNNLNWDPFREQEVSQEFRKKVREFFRIFAYAGIISTQLNKTHSSFLEIIPEEIYTPVVDRFVRATAADISKGSKSEYLNTFRTRFVYNNPDIFNFRSFDRIPNPSLRFFRNYNLNIPQEQLQKDYPNLVPRLKENVPSTPVFPNNINPDVKLPETQIVEDIKQVEKEEAEQLAEESSEYASLEQELQVLQRQLKELRDQEKYARESSPALIVSENLPKINIKSAERETGGKVGVGTQDINYNLVSEKGVSVERAAEEISENILNGIDNVKVEFSDVFNMIVDILFIGKAKFEAKFLPSAAEKKELMKRIAEVKEKIKQQPKQKVRKKFKPVEKIPGQLDLFANKDEIDKLTTENTALINDFFSDDKPVDWNIIDIINNQEDSNCGGPDPF